MICENCNKEFFEDWRKYPKGKPRFCSEKCSRSFSTKSKRKEINEKVSKKLYQGKGNFCVECGKKLSHNNTSGFCKNCKPEAKKKSFLISEFRRKRKIFLVEYKGGKCEICGYDECVWALDFHHLEKEEKKFSLSRSGNTRSLEKDKKEVDKCILVCANCHREIHYNNYNNNLNKAI